jgi:hypothetical protein
MALPRLEIFAFYVMVWSVRVSFTAQFRNGRANLIKHDANIVCAESIYRPFLQLTIGHQVFSQRFECLGIVAAANCLIALQNALPDTRIQHFYVAGDAQSRHFSCEVVELSTPVGVFRFDHGFTFRVRDRR